MEWINKLWYISIIVVYNNENKNQKLCTTIWINLTDIISIEISSIFPETVMNFQGLIIYVWIIFWCFMFVCVCITIYLFLCQHLGYFHVLTMESCIAQCAWQCKHLFDIMILLVDLLGNMAVFRIWNSSTGIPSPPLALFVVMLSKAHLTSHSRMSGSRWVITPS